MKIAAAAYAIDFHENWESYAAKLTAWVDEAAAQGAELLVFPEYAAMELCSLGGRDVAAHQDMSLRYTSDMMPQAIALHADLARRHKAWIVAGSGPAFPGNRPINRAYVFGPDGLIGHQDKQIMTRSEREEFDMVPGDGLRLFRFGPFLAGINICYDSEFPLLARSLAEAGVDLILAPSCTGTRAGYHRVRIGAMARALENQCITVQAPLLGDTDWCPAVGPCQGAAAIYGPPDRGFPETGVIAEGELNIPGWVYADVYPEAVATARADGTVLNLTHWQEQEYRVKLADLTLPGAKNT